MIHYNFFITDISTASLFTPAGGDNSLPLDLNLWIMYGKVKKQNFEKLDLEEKVVDEFGIDHE